MRWVEYAVISVENVNSLLSIRDLVVEFENKRERVRALNGAELSVRPGEICGLVGESGSGKTTLALAILDLIEPPGMIVEGEVIFEGESLLTMPEVKLDRVRGGQIGIVFQNAASSLNPTFTIGYQVAEVLQVHLDLRRAQAKLEAESWLERVGLPGFYGAYPHQLSGGQAQRAMIAVALAPGPKLLVADEPTSALDVTLQSQILQLIRKLTAEQGTAVMLITHDLGVIANMAERVGVMFEGQVVEEVPVRQLFDQPSHPFSQQLIASIELTDWNTDNRAS
jgi:ABC-type dipeptide/oligopeptide/nickel transport system ATPase component